MFCEGNFVYISWNKQRMRWAFFVVVCFATIVHLSAANLPGQQAIIEAAGERHTKPNGVGVLSSFEMTSVWVYTSENHGTSIEVPVTPETTVLNILECVRDPVRGDGYLVAVAGNTEYILQEGDNAYTFLYEIWNSSGATPNFLLRYCNQQAEWPPPELEEKQYYKKTIWDTRRHQMRQSQDTSDNFNKLPGGTGDLTLVELQEMASRQQQMVETQQQVLVAKEQRLKYLRQQESRHAQLASESERLRKIRERVENQELKLKKLRALRDQAELYKINNGQLNSELEAVKTVFSEKEKELAVAVAKVEHLTRQLKDLKNGVTSGMPSNKPTASNTELEKLRKELLMRNKLNEQQSNMIATKEKLLHDRREKVALMDARIHKLQQRLKKRQLQEQQVGVQSSKVTKLTNQKSATSNVVTTETAIPFASQDIKNNLYTKASGYMKQDPRYVTSDIKFSIPNDIQENHSPKEQDVTISDLVEEYKLPVVLPMNNVSNFNENTPRQNSSYSQRPPPPERISRPVVAKNGAFNQNTNTTSKPVPVQISVSKPTSTGSKFFPGAVTGTGHLQRSHVSLMGAGDGSVRESGFVGSDRSQSSCSMLPPPVPSSHPIINISDEERQAGSGQSSPASSENSPNTSSGTDIKSEPVNTSSIGPVSAMIEKLNKNVGRLDGQTQQTSSTITPGLRRLPFTQRSHGPPLEANSASQAPGRSLNGVPSAPNRPTGTHLNTQGLTVNLPPSLPHDELGTFQSGNDSPQTMSSITSSTNSSDTSSITNQVSISGPHLNQKPALTYRYASKNTIANTYMGRLGSAAMEKYQRNLNLLYKNVDSQGSQNATSAEAGITSITAEGTTSFTQSPSANTVPAGNPQFGAAISSPSYPDIASDKGSFKLHTPKQVRRRHSDSENEDLNKALQEQQEKEQQQMDSEAPQDSKVVSESVPSPSTDKSKSSVDKNKNITNAQQTLADINPPESPSSTSAVLQKNENVLSPPVVTKSSSSSKVEAVLRRTKSNLKKDGSRKSNNRVSFDPLALLLDASLEGELDLVKKVALQVDDVSSPNDEGITALHNAICAGHYDIVKVLIEFGCDVNSPDSDGWTPLHCAASCNNLPMVRFLVEHGACVFATTISDHETAADKCEEDEEGYDSCSDYLYNIQEKLGICNNGEVYAVFDYQATNTDELSFRSGDKLTVLRKGDENEKEWWWAQLSGKEGYIPRNLLGLYPRVIPNPKEVSDC